MRKETASLIFDSTRSELRGCINDVHNVRNFLKQRAGYRDVSGLVHCKSGMLTV